MLNDASDTKNFIARYFYVFQHMAWFHFWALMDLSGPGTFQTLKENKSFECFWIIISFNLIICQKSNNSYLRKIGEIL